VHLTGGATGVMTCFEPEIEGLDVEAPARNERLPGAGMSVEYAVRFQLIIDYSIFDVCRRYPDQTNNPVKTTRRLN
jgi:hypothetical protein